jgi:hypothetical protein
MKKKYSVYVIAMTLCVIVSFAILLVRCNKEEENVCDLIKVNGSSISISWTESGCTPIPIETQHNENGEVTSFKEQLSCGSTTYNISVSAITYGADGVINSYNASINGESCNWKR